MSTAAAAPAPNRQLVPGITALRGFAACTIVAFHAYVIFGLPPRAGAPMRPFFERAHLLGDFFFVLSGFVMAHVYGAEFRAGTRWPDVRAFLGARLARLYPLHLVTLATSVVAYYTLFLPVMGGRPDAVHSPFAIVTNLLLVHALNVHDALTWNGPAWALSAEWWTYVPFPFLALAYARAYARHGWRAHAGLALAAAAGLVLLVAFVSPRVTAGTPYVRHDLASLNVRYGWLRCALGFALGMVAERLHAAGWGRAVLGRSAVFCALALFPFLCIEAGLNDLVPVFSIPLLILAAAYSRGLVHRVLELPAFERLGVISYSIYMTHATVIGVGLMACRMSGRAAPSGWRLGAASIAATILVAEVAYRTIEEPARRLLHPRFTGRAPRGATDPRAGAAVPAALTR